MGIAIYRFQELIILSKCQKSSLGYERFSIVAKKNTFSALMTR